LAFDFGPGFTYGEESGHQLFENLSRLLELGIENLVLGQGVELIEHASWFAALFAVESALQVCDQQKRMRELGSSFFDVAIADGENRPSEVADDVFVNANDQADGANSS
jgi:hypothetical protein